MAIGGGLNSNSGGELKLYLDWKRNTKKIILWKPKLSEVIDKKI